MATIAERIQIALDARHMKQVDLVNMTGIGKSSISTYLTGEYAPKQKNLYAIARALSVSPAWLMGLDVPMGEEKLFIATERDSSNILTFQEQKIGKAYGRAIPPVQRTVEVALEPYMEDDAPLDNIIKIDFNQSEQRASAGKGIYLDDESMITIKARAEALPSDYQRNPERYFGVPVGGNSMEPRYQDGDILIVSKEPVNVGEIGIFTMEGEGYVKELGRGVLHSLNPKYENIPLTEDIRCNGKVVGVLDPEDIFEE